MLGRSSPYLSGQDAFQIKVATFRELLGSRYNDVDDIFVGSNVFLQKFVLLNQKCGAGQIAAKVRTG